MIMTQNSAYSYVSFDHGGLHLDWIMIALCFIFKFLKITKKAPGISPEAPKLFT